MLCVAKWVGLSNEEITLIYKHAVQCRKMRGKAACCNYRLEKVARRAEISCFFAYE